MYASTRRPLSRHACEDPCAAQGPLQTNLDTPGPSKDPARTMKIHNFEELEVGKRKTTQPRAHEDDLRPRKTRRDRHHKYRNRIIQERRKNGKQDRAFGLRASTD